MRSLAVGLLSLLVLSGCSNSRRRPPAALRLLPTDIHAAWVVASSFGISERLYVQSATSGRSEPMADASARGETLFFSIRPVREHAVVQMFEIDRGRLLILGKDPPPGPRARVVGDSQRPVVEWEQLGDEVVFLDDGGLRATPLSAHAAEVTTLLPEATEWEAVLGRTVVCSTDTALVATQVDTRTSVTLSVAPHSRLWHDEELATSNRMILTETHHDATTTNLVVVDVRSGDRRLLGKLAREPLSLVVRKGRLWVLGRADDTYELHAAELDEGAQLRKVSDLGSRTGAWSVQPNGERAVIEVVAESQRELWQVDLAGRSLRLGSPSLLGRRWGMEWLGEHIAWNVSTSAGPKAYVANLDQPDSERELLPGRDAVLADHGTDAKPPGESVFVALLDEPRDFVRVDPDLSVTPWAAQGGPITRLLIYGYGGSAVYFGENGLMSLDPNLPDRAVQLTGDDVAGFWGPAPEKPEIVFLTTDRRLFWTTPDRDLRAGQAPIRISRDGQEVSGVAPAGDNLWFFVTKRDLWLARLDQESTEATELYAGEPWRTPIRAALF